MKKSNIFPRHSNYNLPTAIKGEGCYIVDDNGKKKKRNSMVDTFINNIMPIEGESLVNQLYNKVIEWLNENRVGLGIEDKITEADSKEIKDIFTGNFRTIQESPHFDEFLIRQEGGSIWINIVGVIGTDFKNVLKYGFKKEVGEV